MQDYASKIGKLIAMAEDENLPDEARASYRLKAEQLMREYRISEEDLLATDQISIGVVMDEIILLESNVWENQLRSQYATLFATIARHCEIRTAMRYRGDQLVATVVGYQGDIEYAKFIWTAARLVFMTRIDAKVNPSLSDQENAYYLRNSGMPRNEIAKALWDAKMDDGAAHGKVQRLYLAECAKRNEVARVSGRGIQVGLYRKAYADGFVGEFNYRLREARDAADSVGGGLVLHGRKERVDEAFYAEFPNYRPQTEEQQKASQAKWAEEEANCEDCAKTKSKSGKCHRHRPTQATQADIERYWRQTSGPEAKAGMRNGRAAASAVLISRTTGERNARAEAAPSRDELGS